MKKFAGLAVLFLSPYAFGLKTAYVAFEHPDGWKCDLAQGVWICQSTNEAERKESVVLSIATMATEWDTLENYEQYLKQTRTIQDEAGKPVTSKITYTRRRNINGTVWVDSLQQDSELPGFWARYVATVQNKLAILITYIVSKDRYDQTSQLFERMVSTLKPNAEFDLNIASKQGDVPLPGASILGQRQKLLTDRLKRPSTKAPAPVEEEESEETEGDPMLPVYGVGALAVAAVLFLRLRARSKKKAPKQDGPDRMAG